MGPPSRSSRPAPCLQPRKNLRIRPQERCLQAHSGQSRRRDSGELGWECNAPECGRADVNLRDEVARDADGRGGVRDVRADGDGYLCGI